jgi:hypothetical protein
VVRFYEMIIGLGLGMRQASLEQTDPAALAQESPEGNGSGVRTQRLVRHPVFT